ncbi:DUF6734 family protein [Tenacibaculum sp. 190524A02b]|uniref:DUF6734 domain-containing protein n=1 Tax=Tenacibaculum vairaonense TaxID=3137860 RepID=A0ABM9PM96_9FLAO
MKQSPKIIYSLDTYPLINNRWNMGNRLKETIYMTALSVLQSHLWYPEIELYVDETAYKYLYMLPCKVTLIPHNWNADLWMKVKMQAIEKQTQPFVHIDTDIFLSKYVSFDFDKVLLERKEASYKRHYKPQLAFFNAYTNHLTFWHNDLQKTYSCGVIGFNDMKLKSQFIKAYQEVEKVYTNFKQEYIPFKKKGYEPCIVIEQYTLACLLDKHKITPTLLLEGESLFQHTKKAKEIGFSHLFGVKKYEDTIVKTIEERLQNIFPFWYQEIKKELIKSKYMNDYKVTF